MPRYHFNLHDGKDYPDDHGSELRDVAAAKTCAVQYAGDLLREKNDTFWNGQEWRMDVTDDKGLVLFTLLFAAINSPAISSVN